MALHLRAAGVVSVALCVAVVSLASGGERIALIVGERGAAGSAPSALRASPSPHARASGAPGGRAGASEQRGASGAPELLRTSAALAPVGSSRIHEAARRHAAGAVAPPPHFAPPASAGSAHARNSSSPRHFLAFIHVPKMGGTSLRKLFCELRSASWLCPYSYCTNPANIVADLARGSAPWLADSRHVFFEQHCMDIFPPLVSRLRSVFPPLAARGFAPRAALLLREPIASSVSWFWFFNPTQGPLLPTLERFAALRPEFALASLLHAFDQLPSELAADATVRARHGAWVEMNGAVRRAQSASNDLLEGWAPPLHRAMRIGARVLAAAHDDEADACGGLAPSARGGAGGVEVGAEGEKAMGEASTADAAAQRAACASARARAAAATARVDASAAAHADAALPWTRAASAASERAARRGAASLAAALAPTLAKATWRYGLELLDMKRQRDLIEAVHARGRAGCAAVNEPLVTAMRTLDHVLLTASMGEHVNRLLELLGQPAVSFAELRGRARGARGARAGLRHGGDRRRRRLARRELQPAAAAEHADAPPLAWKGEREDRFVFNPSFYTPTPNETRALLAARSPCALALHAYWTAHAPATLGFGPVSLSEARGPLVSGGRSGVTDAGFGEGARAEGEVQGRRAERPPAR